MATYSYSKAQLDKRNQPAKPFWSLNKIAVAAAAFTVTCVAISANQPAPVAVAPVAVAPAAPVVVGNYDAKADECRAKDGSGVFINYTKGPGFDEYSCDQFHSNQNVKEFANLQNRFPDSGKALVTPDRYDMAIQNAVYEKYMERSAAESQARLETWAVRSYEANQKHQDKCQDLMESRGYGEVGCY